VPLPGKIGLSNVSRAQPSVSLNNAVLVAVLGDEVMRDLGAEGVDLDSAILLS
jgi:hypothetical protein